MHTFADLKCQHCGSAPATRRRQNTQYEDAESNFATLCDKCQEETDEYWQEMWDEYYSSQGVYIRKRLPFTPHFSEAEIEAFLAECRRDSFFV